MFLNARHGTQTYTNSWWIDRIQSGMQRILEVHSSSCQPSLLQFSGLYCSSYIRKHSSDEKCHRQFAEVLHSCATCARLSVSTSHVKIWSMSSRSFSSRQARGRMTDVWMAARFGRGLHSIHLPHITFWEDYGAANARGCGILTCVHVAHCSPTAKNTPASSSTSWLFEFLLCGDLEGAEAWHSCKVGTMHGASTNMSNVLKQEKHCDKTWLRQILLKVTTCSISIWTPWPCLNDSGYVAYKRPTSQYVPDIGWLCYNDLLLEPKNL